MEGTIHSFAVLLIVILMGIILALSKNATQAQKKVYSYPVLLALPTMAAHSLNQFGLLPVPAIVLSILLGATLLYQGFIVVLLLKRRRARKSQKSRPDAPQQSQQEHH